MKDEKRRRYNSSTEMPGPWGDPMGVDGDTGTGRGNSLRKSTFMINVCGGMLMIEILVTPQF